MALERFEQLVPQVAADAFVHPHATVMGEVIIGSESTVWPATVLRGDQGLIQIGARTSIQDGSVAHATGGQSTTVIGDECTVGHRVILHGCVVGNRCLVGMGSILLDNVVLGDDCFVAAGTLLTPGKSFPSGSFILGSPGRRIREVSEKEMAWIRSSSRTYVDLCRRYRAGLVG